MKVSKGPAGKSCGRLLHDSGFIIFVPIGFTYDSTNVYPSVSPRRPILTTSREAEAGLRLCQVYLAVDRDTRTAWSPEGLAEEEDPEMGRFPLRLVGSRFASTDS